MTVYWRIKEQKSGSITVEFWTKEDRKDLCTEIFVILDDARLRFRVESKLKVKNYQLEQLGKRV